MNFVDALRTMLRRWYIVIPGLILAVACAIGAWVTVKPDYERQGAQIMLPGLTSLPDGATNPYLYLSGVSLPADVVVQAVMSQNVVSDVIRGYPGTTVVAERSGGSSPIITITVTADSDAAAESVLEEMMSRTVSTLQTMQESEGIDPGARLSITTLSVDTESRQIQRTRALIAGGLGVAVAVAALGLAGLIEGLSRRNRRISRGDKKAGARNRRTSAVAPVVAGDAAVADDVDIDEDDVDDDVVYEYADDDTTDAEISVAEELGFEEVGLEEVDDGEPAVQPRKKRSTNRSPGRESVEDVSVR